MVRLHTGPIQYSLTIDQWRLMIDGHRADIMKYDSKSSLTVREANSIALCVKNS